MFEMHNGIYAAEIHIKTGENVKVSQNYEATKGKHILFNHRLPAMLTCVKLLGNSFRHPSETKRESLLISQQLYYLLLLPSYHIRCIRRVHCQQQNEIGIQFVNALSTVASMQLRHEPAPN